MTLTDLKVECEKDEARVDSLHAKVDKFTKEESEGSSKDSALLRTTQRSHLGKGVAVAIVAAVVVAGALWFLGAGLGGSDNHDGDANVAPVIDSFVIVNTANGMMIWVNASDVDSAISNITVTVYHDAVPLSGPVLERTYQVNQSAANITDILLLGNLPTGDYVIEAHAVDVLGNTSASSGFQRFSLTG